MRLPKKMLVDSFVYEEYLGKVGDYQKESYAPPVNVELVRIDRTSVWTTGGKEDKLLANGVIYTNNRHTTYAKEFVERSKVTYDGKQYLINKVIPKTHVTTNKLFGYEIEVI